MTRGALMRMNPGTASEYLLEPDSISAILSRLDSADGISQGRVSPSSYTASTRALAGLGSELARRQRRREYRVSLADPMHRDLGRAAAHAWELVGWWRDTWPWPPGIASLVEGVRSDCVLGFEASLSGDTRLAAYAGRRLMETEFLLMDFALDSRRFDLWKDSSVHLRMKRFSFGESRKRIERARQIPPGFTLPDQPEYQAHTTDVHPSSGAPVEGANDLTLDFLFGAGDLLEHIARVSNALAALADTLDLPAPAADGANSPEGPLVEVLQKIHDLTKKWGVQDRPESTPRNPDAGKSQ
jgi:hypothetical protein